MIDPVMAFATVLFGILFLFLLFLFTVFVIGVLRPTPRINKSYRPKVSVLIPTYNEHRTLTQCLDALTAAKYPGLEILVIDDGSTDETVRLARSYGKSVRVLTQKHGGKVAALNRGLKSAKGSIIVTIDADTIIEKEFLVRIVQPFADPNVGATSGAVLVANDRSLSGMFQRIEYQYNNLIRRSFSKVFHNGIWFFGCLGAYRSDLLRRLGGFSTDTMAEDMDIAMTVRAAGYKTLNVPDARGSTVVPTGLRALFLQRSRWWVGGLQSLNKHRTMYKKDHNPSLIFLAANQYWWAFYAFLSLPLIIYQVMYWYPPTGGSEAALYLIRWFSLWGPIYVLYKIPEWGINILNIFGVLSGIFSVAMIVFSLKSYHGRITVRDLFAIIFYFPYTIIMNLIVAGSVIRALVTPTGATFVK